MSKNSNRSNNGGGRNDFPIFAAILLGIVLGLALAATIAWFVLKKNPVPVPVAKEPPVSSKPAIILEKPAPGKSAAPATANTEGKARFEFYKELTDKPESGKKHERQETAMLKQQPPKPAETGSYYLQEGAYSSMDDAEKVKAKLALIGMLANIQPANIPEKGLWYRVRLGPYKNTTERDEALATLKLNGLNAAPIKVQ